MHDLIVLPATDAGCLTTSEIEAVMDFAARSKAESTLECYAADWRDFTAWVTFRGGCPLPCPPALVCGYLSHCAKAGLRASTITRRVASIAHFHRQAGIDPPPTQLQAVRTVLAGIKRTIGTAAEQKTPATDDIVLAMLKATSDDMIGKRDRALIALGFAGALRRSELCALELRDLTWTADGIKVLVRKSKGDQEAQGQTIGIPRGSRIRPVLLLEEWLAAAGISEGWILRPVRLGGEIIAKPLRTDDAAKAIKKLAERAGLEPQHFSGHSLRSGFLTSAAKSGASIFKMMDVSRHRSMDTLRSYVRDADLFREAAGAKFL